MIDRSSDPVVRSALRMKLYFAAQKESDALSEWDRLRRELTDSETILKMAALICSELQLDGCWATSLALAEKVLQKQDNGSIVNGLRDEFLYRKALALSRLERVDESIVTAKEGMSAGYPETSFGQRCAVLYCQRALFKSPLYEDAKEILLTVANFAKSEEAFLDAQYALPICEFGLRNFQESSRILNENLARLHETQTGWKQQLYLERFEKSREFMDRFEARLKEIEERHAAFSQGTISEEASR